MIGWHCQGHLWHPASKKYHDYPDNVRRLKSVAEANGFNGIYIAQENWWGAPYPPNGPASRKVEADRAILDLTEIRKAKDMARLFMIHRGLDVVTIWCNTWMDQIQNDGGLLRTSFSADPISPQQPEAAYYVLRNLCTVMDQAKPDENLTVHFSNNDQTFESYQFILPDGVRYAAVWLPGKSVDHHPGVRTDVLIRRVKAKSVSAIDTLNGFEQALDFEVYRDITKIPNLQIRDYPLILKIK